jgi:type IV pilus assembly protein PilY1
MKNTLQLARLISLIALTSVSLAAVADDTDIYFSDSALDTLGIKPNILFILDTSGSMNRTDMGSSVTLPPGDITNVQFPTNTGLRRISHMKRAMYDYLENTNITDDVNVGLMRFNREGAGVVYPVAAADTYNSELTDSLAAISVDGTTPVVDALYEAALYFTGDNVYYGLSRGTRGDPTVIHTYASEYRISHPDSVVSGSATDDFPSGCSSSNLNDPTCKDRRWETTGGTALTPGQTTLKYKSPITQQCQPNHLVLLTDGTANGNGSANLAAQFSGLADAGECNPNDSASELCGVELINYIRHNDLIDDATLDADQTITTHTIGFNNIDPWLQDLADAGGGLYKTATSAGDLATVLSEITSEVLDTSSTFAAPVATINQFNRLVQRNEVYFAVFRPESSKRWEGNIKRFKIGVDGSESNVILDKNNARAINASDGFFRDTSQDIFDDRFNVPAEFTVEEGGVASQLSSSRNIYTWFGGNKNLYGESGPTYINRIHEDNNALSKAVLLGDTSLTAAEADALMTDAERSKVVSWARGIDVNDVDDDSDITDARLRIGDPLHSKPVVVTYGGDDESPILTMFYGTNEGYFHAVDANSGEELWSFIPQELLENLEPLSEQESGSHIYGVDGAATVWVNDVDNDGVIETEDNDFVYVYFGLRRGGTHYYALDVTNRNSPKVLWQISRGDTDFADLGQTWSKPIKTVVGISNGLTGINKTTEAKHVLLFAGGYDDDQDDDVDGVNNLNRNTDSQGNAIYMVDAQTGTLLWRADDSSFPEMQYSIPAALTVADTNSNGYANQFYVGDMGGQIWRFDVNTGAELNANFISGGVVAELADNTDAGARRFYQSPDVSLISRKNSGDVIGLTIGSGWRAKPNETAVTDRFYMLEISDPYTPPENGSYNKLTEPDLYDATDNLIGVGTTDQQAAGIIGLAAKSGWYITMGTAMGNGAGEKILSVPLTIDGKVLFATYEPTATLVNCAPTPGTARAYLVSLFDATTENDTNRFETLKAGTIVDEPVLIITSMDVVVDGETTTTTGGATFFGTEKSGLELGNDLAIRTFWYQKD